MSDMEKDLHVPSAGWTWLYRPIRRGSSTYISKANVLTQTSGTVSLMRTKLIALAGDEGMQPPLTRPDIRKGTRDDEIIEKLGAGGLWLLAAHDVASQENIAAMFELRNENQKIAAGIIRASNQVEPQLDRQKAIVEVQDAGWIIQYYN